MYAFMPQSKQNQLKLKRELIFDLKNPDSAASDLIRQL